MELCGTAGEPGAKLWGALGGTGSTPSSESPTLSSPSGSEEYHCVPPPLRHRLHWVLRYTVRVLQGGESGPGSALQLPTTGM